MSPLGVVHSDEGTLVSPRTPRPLPCRRSRATVAVTRGPSPLGCSIHASAPRSSPSGLRSPTCEQRSCSARSLALRRSYSLSLGWRAWPAARLQKVPASGLGALPTATLERPLHLVDTVYARREARARIPSSRRGPTLPHRFAEEERAGTRVGRLLVVPSESLRGAAWDAPIRPRAKTMSRSEDPLAK